MTLDDPAIFDDLAPSGDHAYLIPAWFGCLRWALGKDDIMAAFRAETGNAWEPGRTAAGRQVDRATGADAAFFRAFAAWMNENVWGQMDDDPAEPEEAAR